MSKESYTDGCSGEPCVNGYDRTGTAPVEYTLRQFCHRNRDGSHNTQVDRMRSLALAARQLREAGFR
ncbi:MAG: hypothetical protein KIS65_02075 [Nitrosomonas sp.]|nr:hypothetical protein [Nitrosomonas sp.]MCW5617990.1 hypothetical protein [Nitrosomonas sp.]